MSLALYISLTLLVCILLLLLFTVIINLFPKSNIFFLDPNDSFIFFNSFLYSISAIQIFVFFCSQVNILLNVENQSLFYAFLFFIIFSFIVNIYYTFIFFSKFVKQHHILNSFFTENCRLAKYTLGFVSLINISILRVIFTRFLDYKIFSAPNYPEKEYKQAYFYLRRLSMRSFVFFAIPHFIILSLFTLYSPSWDLYQFYCTIFPFFLCITVGIIFHFTSYDINYNFQPLTDSELNDLNDSELDDAKGKKPHIPLELFNRTAALYDAIIANNFYEVVNFVGNYIVEKDSMGWTGLHLACALKDRTKIVEQMIKLLKCDGFLPSSPTVRTRKEGWTPFIVAMLFGQLETAKILLTQNFAAIDDQDHYGHNIMRLAFERKKIEPTIKFIGNEAALILAANNGVLVIVRDLLAIGTNIETKDANGYTPFLTALKGGFPKTALWLLDHNANIHATTNDGLKAIHIAARKDVNVVIIDKLLDSGMTVVDVVPITLRQPIHFSMEAGRVLMTKLLLDKNADFDCKDAEGITPIVLGRRSKNPELIKFIRQRGTSILAAMIPKIPSSKSVILPLCDLCPMTDPSYVWFDFLSALQRNSEADLLIDTTQAKLSHSQVAQIVTALRTRNKQTDFPIISTSYCGLVEHRFDVEFIVQNQEFSVQKMARESSTKHSITTKQKEQTETLPNQILGALLAFFSFPYWILFGLFDYLFDLRKTTLKKGDEELVETYSENDSFFILFGVHLDKNIQYLDLFPTKSRKVLLAFFILCSTLTFLYPFCFILFGHSILTSKAFYILFLSILSIYIILPLTIVLKILWKDPNLTSIEFPQVEITSFTFRNVLAFFSIFLDLYQLCALTFVQERFHSESRIKESFQYGLLSFNALALDFEIEFVFFIIVFLVLFWLFISSYIFYATYKSQPWLLTNIPKLNLFCSILANTLFITIISKLFSMVNCTSHGSYSTLDSSSDDDPVYCWEGSHISYSIIALILLILYVWSCNIIGPFYHSSFKISLEVHIFTTYYASERFLKLLATIASLFFAHSSFALFRLFILLALYSFLFLLALRFKPADNVSLNQLKISFALMAAWSVFCSIIAELYGEEGRETWVPVIFLFAGFCLILLFWSASWAYGKYIGVFLWGLNEELQVDKNKNAFYNPARRLTNIFSLPQIQDKTITEEMVIEIEDPFQIIEKNSNVSTINSNNILDSKLSDRKELKPRVPNPNVKLDDDITPSISQEFVENEFTDKLAYSIQVSININTDGKKKGGRGRNKHKLSKKSGKLEPRLERISEESFADDLIQNEEESKSKDLTLDPEVKNGFEDDVSRDL